MSKLNLQPGKTYVTNSGEHITLEGYEERDPFYTFEGSNCMYYGDNGCIYENANDYYNPDIRADDISHELIQDTEDENWHDSSCDICEICDSVTHRNGKSSDNTLENLIFVTPEENRQPKLIDVLKFKQKSNGTKRKLTLKDYSDDSVEIIFKTKFSKDRPQVTTGIRLSYEAILLLYDSLEYMLEENQRTLH